MHFALLSLRNTGQLREKRAKTRRKRFRLPELALFGCVSSVSFSTHSSGAVQIEVSLELAELSKPKPECLDAVAMLLGLHTALIHKLSGQRNILHKAKNKCTSMCQGLHCLVLGGKRGAPLSPTATPWLHCYHFEIPLIIPACICNSRIPVPLSTSQSETWLIHAQVRVLEQRWYSDLQKSTLEMGWCKIFV